jgi:tRNA A-37 threonylcarbamoyl transferase component Bud32
VDKNSDSASVVEGPEQAEPLLPEFQPGAVLQGTYRILRPLACGGMGEVYEATHERLPGAFAIKALHREFIHDEDALARFRYEAEIMAALRHPNIVQVLDFNVTDTGLPYLVMELIEGKDLSEHLQQNPQPMPAARVARIIRQTASALEAAHGRGVIHRDLKPENVMLMNVDGQEDFVKVLDFGVSKVGWSHRVTAEWAILGTPQFMSPEQAQGRREEVDHRSDQFALAAMTYTLLTGHEPFRGESTVTVLYQVVHQDPDPLSQFVGWPSAHTDAVLRRAMAKNREARFPGVLAFARALDEAIRQDLGSAVAQQAATPPPAPMPVAVPIITAPAVIGGPAVTDIQAEIVPVAPVGGPVDVEWAATVIEDVTRPPWPRRRQSRFRRRKCSRTTLVTMRRRSRMLTRQLVKRVRSRPRLAAAGLLAVAAVATMFYLDMVGWQRVGSVFGAAIHEATEVTSRTVARLRPAPERPGHQLPSASGGGATQLVPIPALPAELSTRHESGARSVAVTP